MNQQQYRLLCMDIDGTLLNSAHKLPPANREAVQSAAKNGVTICLMSARPPRAVFPIRDALGVDGPLVCCGGGLILSGENRLAAPFPAPADRGTRTAAGGFALTGGSFSCTG